MGIEKITEMTYRTKGFLKNNVQYNLMRIKNPTFVKALSQNIIFQGKHAGERCFILGNGPSLRNETLSLLKNETIFTVNQIARLNAISDLRLKYHFWVDSNFFSIDVNKPEDMELLSTMRDVGRYGDDVVCFFPIEQYDFCQKFNLESYLNIHYFAHSSIIHENYSERIDFCRYTPGFGTVVQNCITMAIYMGFGEIYLLGCDNTGIMVTLKTALQSNDENDYAYELSRNEIKRMSSMVSKGSIEDYATSYANTLRDYRILREYCDTKRIKLVNCSSTTVIDSIPRMRLEDVFK